MIVYFSSASGYTHRFVQKVGVPATRIPIESDVPMPTVDEPCVLIVPTFGAGPNTQAVPRPVIRFLNIEQNRNQVKGVIGTGNTNFGDTFGYAADVVAQKLRVPVLYKLEISGTPVDVERVREGVPEFLRQAAQA